MNDDAGWIWIAIAVFVFICVIVGICGYWYESSVTSHNNARLLGVKSCGQNIPIYLNPYTDADDRLSWYDGYAKTLEESK